MTGVALITFFACFIAVPMFLGLLRMFGVYEVVPERVSYVYVLFGKVILILDEPGVALLWARMGWRAPLVRWMGTRYVLDMRLDQTYLRSQPVNSEEGAPMGIGIWYEMFISDPVSYLFKNNDPRGSLRANVSISTARRDCTIFWSALACARLMSDDTWLCAVLMAASADSTSGGGSMLVIREASRITP